MCWSRSIFVIINILIIIILIIIYFFVFYIHHGSIFFFRIFQSHCRSCFSLTFSCLPCIFSTYSSLCSDTLAELSSDSSYYDRGGSLSSFCSSSLPSSFIYDLLHLLPNQFHLLHLYLSSWVYQMDRKFTLFPRFLFDCLNKFIRSW